MESTCLVGLVLTVVIGVAFSSDKMAYEALITRIDRLEGKVEFLEHRVSTLEARDTSQQRVISEQRSTIARQQTSLRDFFVKYGQKNRILRSRVQHLEHILASNTRMAENTAPKQVANTEEEQQSELAQERPESGSPKMKERNNHHNSGPSMSQVPGRTASIGKPAVGREHSDNSDTSQQRVISEQRSTIAQQQTSLRDFFVKHGQKNRILRSRVQHLQHIIASNTRMAENKNTVPKQVANTEEEQQSELGQEVPVSGSPKVKERINHSKSPPSISQVPGRTSSTGKPAVNGVHSDNTVHAKRLLVAASVDDGPVAFMARMDTSKSNIGINQTLDFETVLMNIGNGYHDLHGYFIAPKAGIYMFSSAIVLTAINVAMEAEIVHNGNSVCGIFANGDLHYHQSAQTALIQLAQGDEVWVRNLNRNHVSLLGQGYSTFSGYLLWPM